MDAITQKQTSGNMDEAENNPVPSVMAELWQAMARLDQRLKRAVELARSEFGPEGVPDPFRGLYLSDDTVSTLLERTPGMPLYPVEVDSPEQESGSRLLWLARSFGLSLFELDIILLVLAPELELRYERLYAFLQDDVSKRRPSVDLALNLLCAGRDEKLACRSHFSASAPLVRHRLLHLYADPQYPQTPLLGHYLKLDEQIIHFLLNQQTLDSRLTACCELSEPVVSLDDLPSGEVVQAELQQAVLQASEGLRPLCLYLQGANGAGKQQAAAAVAAGLGMSLLTADIAKAQAQGREFAEWTALVLREGWFQNALVYFKGLDELLKDEHRLAYEQLLDALVAGGWSIVLGGSKPWIPERGRLGVISIELGQPSFSQRRKLWQAGLEAERMRLDDVELDKLVGRFQLTPGQIGEAVAVAAKRVGGFRSDEGEAGVSPLELLFTAARAQTNRELAHLAQKIDPHYRWDDLVLPEDEMAQLHEICQRVTQRHRVFDEWGFGQKLSYGKGVSALFSGPSGTGKTMAAEVIANELGLDLYKIDLARVVSKYIGETEKNLDRIFEAATNANAILFFDEADALFGKRSEVHDAHDRYANIEISYLLQKMEAYEGVTILATNLRKNLDDAFMRRLAFIVQFPFPNEASRRDIWVKIWPIKIKLDSSVKLELLAQQFTLSGGNIKNIALTGAYLAANTGDTVTMGQLQYAIRREYQKLGKTITKNQLGEM